MSSYLPGIPLQTSFNTVCGDGPARVVNSTYHRDNDTHFYGGSVEVCYNDTYHPLCGEGWTDNDAAIMCNKAGYRYPYYRKWLI